MYKDKYSPKEIMVFEGFNKLLDEGISLSNIRVADVAKAAGIGKGTVYEYFKSKEEVVAKSILYQMQSEFISMVEKSSKATNFKEKCYVAFEEMIRVMARKVSYMQLLFTDKDAHQVLSCINKGKDELVELRNFMLEILEHIIEMGIKEGIINPNLEKIYIQSTFVSVFSGISTIVHFSFKEFNEEEIETHLDISYQMLISALR